MATPTDPANMSDRAVVDPAPMSLRLYLAPGAPNSERALANLRRLIAVYLAGCFELEIVDVRKQPRRALADDALVTPTLVRLSPLPVVRIVGNLSQTAKVLEALGLKAKEIPDGSQLA